MITLLLVGVFGAIAYLVPRQVMPLEEARRFGLILVAGFALRLLANVVLRQVSLFSHGGPSQGDAVAYEVAAWAISRIWDIQGFSWIPAEQIEIPQARNAMLACHVYAAITWLNGGEVPRLACVALNSFLACLTCVQLYRLATMIGGEEAESRFVALAMFFGPGFVFHTSDLFKDGLSAFLVITAIVLAFRLAERFRPGDVVLGVLCLWALWYVRYYLVFLVSAPLALSLLGFRSASAGRVAVSTVFMLAAALVLIATQAADEAIDVGVHTYQLATSDESRS